jgi:hypothetical protein
MSGEELTLAEAYYKVAADLEYRARWYSHMAADLNRIADELCEESIREKSTGETES